jgi:sucrose-6-phosphatase
MRDATHLLATDLDGTLVGSKEGLDSLLSYYKSQPYKVALVYITGRHLLSVLELIEEERLPKPELLITDVGTKIFEGQTLKLNQDWQKRMEKSWEPERVKSVAARFEGLIPQNIAVDTRLSFHVSNDDELVNAFNQQLNREGISHKLIYSSGKDVDILPPDSGKGEALKYIIETYGYSDANLLVAGDSGNDLEMLSLGYPAVVVGNAQKELVTELRDTDSIYRAKAECAGGILEAWEYFYGEQ